MSDLATFVSSGQKALRFGRCSLPGHVYHVTTCTYRRTPLFLDFHAARAVIRSLNAPAVLRDTELFAWVLMPDHLHMLLQLGQLDGLSDLVNRLKGVSARSCNLFLRRSSPVWQRSFHDHLLREEEDLKTVARYIVMNPFRAGLVSRISEYPHWDAVWVGSEDGRA